MDVSVSPQGQKQNLQSRSHKSTLHSNKDLFSAVKDGTLNDVELALVQLKKCGGDINWRNAFGLTPLHIASWRNHVPVLRRLLAAGADPNARDGESGWSSLHRALHFGHLAVASVLLQSGASVLLEDSKSRIPVDLISGYVSQNLGDVKNSVATGVFSWGSGANYQLGTGKDHIQKFPCIVDSLHGVHIKSISAAKFHSVAVSVHGELFTWGFGRGGRLGQPDFDIHSGQGAVITPIQVIAGLGSRRVRAIVAAKHHTVVATESGDVFTWGSNREGQLGYTSVDTQPTPRRVSSLKCRIVAVAAANKHTAVVSDTGEVFTWGCNKDGQLGYGTSNSGSNYTPRLVESLKGKVFTGIAAAKHHTIVLGADGEVYTWGHRLVNPRRVLITRNVKKSGGTPLTFHRMQRLHVVSVAAGMVHSMALTDDGTLFYWVSSDPDVKCQQLYSFTGSKMVSISAGKYWSAAVTSTGNIYMWDGKQANNKPPPVTRLHGVKKATSVAVGETHLLILTSTYHPEYFVDMTVDSTKQQSKIDEHELLELDEGVTFSNAKGECFSSSTQNNDALRKVPSLKSLCEKVAAESLVEPRNALTLLEISDTLGADGLRRHCEEIIIRNLDYIFTVSPNAVASTSLDILAHLEKLLDAKSSEPWSHRQLPTPTATLPVVLDSEGEEDDNECHRNRGNNNSRSNAHEKVGKYRSRGLLLSSDNVNSEINKQVRVLCKKLQQIEVLEAKWSTGHVLNEQQIAKIQSRPVVEGSLAALGVPIETLVVAGSSSSAEVDGKLVKKEGGTSRKQRRKGKQQTSKPEAISRHQGSKAGQDDAAAAELLAIKVSHVTGLKEEAESEESPVNQPASQESTPCLQKSNDVKSSNGLNHLSSKKKSRKGGLSMFLSGGLDHAPKIVTPPPPPKKEGHAWGGSKVSEVSSSLRDILDEQKTTNVNAVAGEVRNHPEDRSGSGKILLSSYLPSKPIPVAASQSSRHCEGEKSPLLWSGSTTPPLSRPSLRDIQSQQVKRHSFHQIPKTSPGFAASSGQGSPSDSSASPNRWYKPEINSPSSIRSIQIEEKAMKDLRRFYSSVKVVVKDQS